MTKLRMFLRRVVMVFHRSRIEADIDEEIRSHLEMEADEQQRTGMSASEARQAALRNFGGVDQVKERYRDRYRFQSIEDIFQDLRFALRTLRKSPGFTAVAVMTLSLGIGINTAIFSVTNAALFKGFPTVKENDRVVDIENNSMSYPEFEDWRVQARSFSSMAAVSGLFKFVSGSREAPEILSGVYVTPDIFRVLGVNPQLGRDLAQSDGEPGAAPIAILSYELWKSRFSSDPGVVGRTLQLNGVPTAVVGVMPEGLSFPQRQDLWLPIVRTPEILRRDRRLGSAYGRLAEGVTIDGARAEMETIGRRLESEYPQTTSGIPVRCSLCQETRF